MIVKILKKSATFKAVRYNTGKVERDCGELLLVHNFGVLQGIENLRPQDYINYLEALSSRNSRIKCPQFHVAISSKGREHSKEELSTIAQQWMQGMGYGEQPYLLIYHKDTANNHIHIVSSRIGRNEKKITDSYEKIRAYRVLNQILGEDEHHTLSNQLHKALSYSFSTRSQFAMLLELQGYALRIIDPVFKISKYGRVVDEIDLTIVDTAIAARENNKPRIAQIRAIIQRYANKSDRASKFLDNKYSSPLASFLHEKFGLQIIFHGKEGKSPYGYTVIDHIAKSVFKGGEIMPLSDFIIIGNTVNKEPWDGKEADKQMVLASTIKKPDDNITSAHIINPIALPATPSTMMEENANSILPHVDLNISDDVDDEAVYGRRRRGKQKN